VVPPPWKEDQVNWPSPTTLVGDMSAVLGFGVSSPGIRHRVQSVPIAGHLA
jgi:hypothetical protein